MTNLTFEHIEIAESYDPMVDMANYPFVMAPMYFEWGLSDSAILWTRKTIADKLLDIQKKQLAPLGRQFKIWDPWRSRIVQNNIYQKFWDELVSEHPDWDEKKVTHEVGVFVTKADQPGRIPPHATGGSIDLTIVEADGTEIDFGTIFDHFGPEAATDYFEKNEENNTVRDNRRWLHKIMKDAGFETDDDEWWHFDYGNQKWAVHAEKAQAFYGEVINPLEFNLKKDRGPKHAIS